MNFSDREAQPPSLLFELFMLPYALNYSDCRTELLNHRLALLWVVLRSHEALMTRKLWTFFIKSFPKLLAS